MMNFGTGVIPSHKLNTFFLEPDQVQLTKIKVYLKFNQYAPLPGQIHVSTRSLLFCPESSQQSILRAKYSDGLAFKIIRNLAPQTISQIQNSNLSIPQFRNINAKNIHQLFCESKQHSNQPPRSNPHDLRNGFNLTKIQQPSQIRNYIVIRVAKVQHTKRSNIGPYDIAYNSTLTFLISASETKQSLWQWVRCYHFCNDPKIVQRHVIKKVVGERSIGFLDKQNNYLASEVKLDGLSYGVLAIQNDGVRYTPLVNGFYEESSLLRYSSIKYLRKFRHQFQWDSLQIWTYQHQYSRLFKISKQHLDTIYNNIKLKSNPIQYDLQKIRNQWASRQINNYDYLMYLNIQANRSFNDISQYPVFPWIIHEFNTQFNLENKSMFRNLSLPIGAINKHRIKRLKVKQQQLNKYNNNTPLYRIHYSLPCNIKYFLIRKIPSLILRLQQQAVVPPDRIFVGVEETYYNTLNLQGDFKESIPQFYGNNCEIFVNSSGLTLGKTKDQKIIDNTTLPIWSKTQVQFAAKMRQCLQSQYVSEHLNQWIDLIFGYKQKGEYSVKSDNHFDPEFFEENFQIQKLNDLQILARKRRIRDFGQMAIQLFNEPHSKVFAKQSKQDNFNKLVQIRNHLKKLQLLMQEYPLANYHLQSLQSIVLTEEGKNNTDQNPDSSLGSQIKADIEAIQDFFDDDIDI